MVVVRGKQCPREGDGGRWREQEAVESLYTLRPVLLALWRLPVLTRVRSRGVRSGAARIYRRVFFFSASRLVGTTDESCNVKLQSEAREMRVF